MLTDVRYLAIGFLTFGIISSSHALACTIGDLVSEIEGHPEIYHPRYSSPAECKRAEVRNKQTLPPNLHDSLKNLPVPLQGVGGLLGTTYGIVNYGTLQTDGIANHGWVAYVNDLVFSDPQFFRSTFLFYKRLLDYPEQEVTKFGLPIESKRKADIFTEALRFAHNDKVKAMAILSIYGHDDFQHALNIVPHNPCENWIAGVMDSVQPSHLNNLYAPGVLGGVEYSRANIEKGQSIAKKCAEFKDSYPLAHKLCNDGLPSGVYMADYYHVIAAAAISCRSITNSKSDQGPRKKIGINELLLNTARNLAGGDESLYLDLAAVYKVQRFKEEIQSIEQKVGTPFLPLLKFAFNRLTKCTPLYEAMVAGLASNGVPELSSIRFTKCDEPNLPPLRNGKIDGFPDPVAPEIYSVVRAIMDRYEFEIEFRKYQHQLGLEFGVKACSNYNPGNDSANFCPK